MDKLTQHFKIALRMLGRRPGLSAGRLLTVTMVVTAVSAVFAVANAASTQSRRSNVRPVTTAICIVSK